MASSPYDDNAFATANTFTNVLHSTPYQGNTATMELQYERFPEPADNLSDGSAEMSIEIGRGIKPGMNINDDISSNAIFSFGNDHSHYQVTGTPPLRQRATPRKSNGALRKEASVRRATESSRANDALKRSVSGAKRRAVSDNAPRLGGDDVSRENTQPTATFQVRGSRFARQISSTYTGLPSRFTADGGLQLGQETPRRLAAGNATVQSATYTAQSFMLPDIPDITELVSGVRQNGTPLKRGPVPRSRFVSASFRPQPLPDVPVTAIPVPDEEKAIYAGIQLLHGKNLQLETANSEAQKRAEECEKKVVDIQGQLNVATQHPDSALGSEEEDTIPARTGTEQSRLQSKVKALQELLHKAERKISISEITVSRVTKERDSLITQIGNAYFQSEELAKENEIFRESYVKLQEENEDLKEAGEGLRQENEELRERLSKAGVSRAHTKNAAQQKVDDAFESGSKTRITRVENNETTRSRQRSRQRPEGQVQNNEVRTRSASGEGSLQRRRSSLHSEHDFVPDLATRIELEVQKRRNKAAAKAQEAKQVNSATTRTRSKSRPRSNRPDEQICSRSASAPAEVEAQEAQPSRTLSRVQHSKSRTEQTDDEDLTQLSDLDALAIANLRRKLEAERIEGRQQKEHIRNRAENEGLTAQSFSRQPMPRKSSLKDLTGRTDDGTGRLSLHGETLDDIVKATKTVRVQSPHSSQVDCEQQATEVGNLSVLSNISRRRRRSASTEGMTSAFIIPDITLHGNEPSTWSEKACIQHDSASCTICCADQSQVVVTMPVPVTDREGYGDETSATVRPAQEPAVALAIVIRNLEDEIKHLKIQRETHNRLYNQHNPALSKRRRQLVKANIDKLTAEIEKRSDQVYKLYDVLEGQKQASQLKADGKEARQIDVDEVEETLQSLGIDPAELSGRIARTAPALPVGLGGADDLSDAYDDDDELPWEGLSDVESEADLGGV